MPQATLSLNSEIGSNSAPSPFVCTCQTDGFRSICIHLEGELDLANAPEFRRVLATAQSDARIVSLDLQKLTFIDCTALQVVLEADAAARQTDARLILVLGSGQVDRMLGLTGVLERMEVVDFRSAVGPSVVEVGQFQQRRASR